MGSESDNQSKVFSPRLGEDELGRILNLKKLQEQKSRGARTPLTASDPKIPSWEEIYRLVSPHAVILQALLAPADSVEEYYQGLFRAALDVGLRDPALLLSLLWHAPHGDALQKPERWEYLLDLVTAGLHEHPGMEPTGSTLEPLVNLEERVVIQRYRYEAMLLELRELSARAAELERQLAEWAQTFVPEKIPPEEKAGASLGDLSSHPLGFLHGWTDLERQVSELVDSFLPDAGIPEDQRESFLDSLSSFQEGSLQDLGDILKKKAQQAQQEDEIEAAIQECLEENPDLAQDERKVEMLHYCLKNYVNFHPDLMGLPLRERVAEACRMARDFLGEPVKNNV